MDMSQTTSFRCFHYQCFIAIFTFYVYLMVYVNAAIFHHMLDGQSKKGGRRGMNEECTVFCRRHYTPVHSAAAWSLVAQFLA